MIRILLVLVCVASAAAAPQQNAPELLAAATEAYRAGRDEEALRGFQRALPFAGSREGAVLYDMGNCAFRLGRLAEAVWWYRRALARLPGEPRVERNLMLAERRLGVWRAQGEADPGPVERLAAAIARVPPLGWLALAALLQTAGLLGALAAGRGRRTRRLLWLLVGLAGVGAALRVISVAWLEPPAEAVVLDAEAELHVEPHRDERVALRLPAGELVVVAEASDRWVRVEHRRGAGWMQRSAVGFVTAEPGPR